MEWISMVDGLQYDQQLQKVVATIDGFIGDSAVSKSHINLVKSQNRLLNRQVSKNASNLLFNEHEERDLIQTGQNFIQFLKDCYHTADTIPWALFEQKFYEINGPDLEKLCSFDNEAWLLGILYRELEVFEGDENVSKQNLLEFTDNNLDAFWENVEEQAVQSYAMREVFNMDSSVRIPAIMNLCKL